jgi:hypothetical protein
MNFNDYVTSQGNNADNAYTGNDPLANSDPTSGAVPLPPMNVSGGTDPTNAGFTYDQNGNLVDTSGGLPSNTPTTTDLSGGNTTSSGGNMGILNSLTNGLGSVLGITDPKALSSLIPYLGMALQQFQQSGQYRQYAQQEAGVANPFGQYRNQAGQQLMALEQDPSKIAQTPGYQFALNQALQNVQAKEASAGYGGTDTERNALATEASGLAQQTYNNTIKQLSDQAGVQFSPDAAAQLLSQGNMASMLSQSNALGALMAPFGIQSGNNIINNSTGTNGGAGNGSGGSGINMGNLANTLTNLGNSNQSVFNPNYSGPALDQNGNSTSTSTDNFTSFDNSGNALDQNGNPFGMGGGE